MFATVIITMWDAFSLYPLPALYIFDPDVQTSEFLRGCNGICTMTYGANGKPYYAIGLADYLLDTPDEFVLVMLHEFCHIVYCNDMGHYPMFHKTLDHLLAVYNRRMGTNIENDYQQMAEWLRYDSAGRASVRGHRMKRA